MNSFDKIIDDLLFEEDEWTPIIGYEFLKNYKDEHPNTTIVNKIIGKVNGISLSGEKNSEYITFQMNRNYDGIDLSEKLINICYRINNTENGGSNAPINVYMNNEAIKFGWLLPEAITMQQCSITFIVLIVGKEYEKDYVLKTKIAKYSVENGFECGQGISKPDDNWFDQFLIRIDAYIRKKAEEFADNYEELKNKPILNGVVISGNKTSADYGISSGTSNYSNLTNKPRINSIELVGNKTLEQLGIVSLTDEEIKEIIDSIGGNEPVESNYSNLTNKPRINSIELVGNKTLEQLGIPIKTSQLTNDSNFISDSNYKTIIYSETEPSTVEANEIVYVYE